MKPKTKNYLPICTTLPLGGEAETFMVYCKQINRSQSWVTREALREFMIGLEQTKIWANLTDYSDSYRAQASEFANGDKA